MEFVVMLLFSLPGIASEYVKTVEFNITIHGDYIKCTPTRTDQEKLVDSDNIRIVAHIPQTVKYIEYMWCKNRHGKSVGIPPCTTYTSNNGSECITNGTYKNTENGEWKCDYLMLRNDPRKVRPTEIVDSNQYTKATCKFNVLELVRVVSSRNSTTPFLPAGIVLVDYGNRVEVSDGLAGRLWFTGLDPNRRTIQRNRISDLYTYTYEMGEALTVDCKLDNPQKRVFQLYNSTNRSSSQPQTLTSPFEIKASANLNETHLICRFQDIEAYTHEIRLEFTSGQLWFTGINPNQTSIEQYRAYFFYKYKPGENLEINCATDMKGGSVHLHFHDIGTAKGHLESLSPPFYYTPDQNTNGSYLLCSYMYGDGNTVPFTAELVFILESYLPARSTTPLVIVTPTPTTTKATKPTSKSTTKPKKKPKPTKRPKPIKPTMPTKPMTPTTSITPTKQTTELEDATTRLPTKAKTTTKENVSITKLPTATTATTSALIQIDIESTDIMPSESNTRQNKYYTHTYSDSKAKLTLRCVTDSNKPHGVYKLKMKGPGYETSEVEANFRNKLEYEVTGSFELRGESGEIRCTSLDADTSTSSTVLTAIVHYNYKPDSNVLTAVQSQLFVEHNFIYIVLIAAALVTVFAILCTVVVYRRRNSTPQDDSVNLADNQQHSYNTLPVSKPRTVLPRKALTVEDNYSEPKDSNDMSEALYVDPRRMDDTYAEPYVQLYAQPIPKSLRKPKIKDDPNYSNAFGKDLYVNSLRT